MSITREAVRKLETRPVTTSNIRKRINLMGVGGVGSNLVRTICRDASRFAVRIYDHDEVELHNLNRTSMFKLSDAIVRKKKVYAIRERANELTGGYGNPIISAQNLQTDRESEFDQGIIIDARDTLDPLKVPPKTWLKLAYDGGSDVSFTWLPVVVADKVFDMNAGRSNTYEVVTNASGKCPRRASNSSMMRRPHSRLNAVPCSISTSPSKPSRACLNPAARAWLTLSSGRAPINAI